MREDEMEILADTPRTEPQPGKETFPVNFANTKCYRCRKNLDVGTTGGWLIKPVKRPEDHDPKDDKVHYDCWWDRVWYYEHGMIKAEDRNPPGGDPGINLGAYDQPVVKETVDPLMFTKAKLQEQMIDRQYQEQPIKQTINEKHVSDRELATQIGGIINSLQEIRTELHEVYKKLHHPYYGQD